MRQRIVRALMAAGICGTCVAGQPSYKTEVKISPAATVHEYIVEFKITSTGKDGKPDVVGAPRITVNAGQEGRIKICDREERDGVFCIALVNENEGSVDALTSVIVKARGQETLNCAQNVVVTK